MTLETTSLSARREHLRQVLTEQGIQEPTASELADLPHVNPEYVTAHVRAAAEQRLKIGIAIERMRLASSPPELSRPRTRKDEVQEKMRRFVEGE